MEHCSGFISEEIILESNDIEKDLSGFELVGKDCTVGSGLTFSMTF